MKIAGAIAAVFILIGVLGYVLQHESASPVPAPRPSSSAAAPAPTPSLSAATVENGPATTDQQRVRISSDVVEGMAIYKPAPQYPQMARIAHISGDVVLKVTIDRTGRVTNVVAVQGHPILIQSAIDAVKQWKYRPYVFNGEAVAIESTVKVKYHM
jgi:protein TonB